MSVSFHEIDPRPTIAGLWNVLQSNGLEFLLVKEINIMAPDQMQRLDFLPKLCVRKIFDK